MDLRDICVSWQYRRPHIVSENIARAINQLAHSHIRGIEKGREAPGSIISSIRLSNSHALFAPHSPFPPGLPSSLLTSHPYSFHTKSHTKSQRINPIFTPLALLNTTPNPSSKGSLSRFSRTLKVCRMRIVK